MSVIASIPQEYGYAHESKEPPLTPKRIVLTNPTATS